MKYPLRVGDQIYFTKIEHDDEQFCEIVKGKIYTIEKGKYYYDGETVVYFIDESGDKRNYPLSFGFVDGDYDYELIEEENE